MKKTALTLFFLLYVVTALHAQTGTSDTTSTITSTDSITVGSSDPIAIINDALFIAANKTNRAVITERLKPYHNFGNAITENYFLKNYVTDSLFYKFRIPKSGENSFPSNIASIGNIASSVGGLDVTTIADGISKFIVKRTKQELSIAFFRNFKDDLKKYPDLESIFPNTNNLLYAIDQQIYNYANYLENLREAFRADLLVLDENLPSIINNHPDFFNKPNNHPLASMLKSACYISSSLKHDIHPGDILDGFPINFFNDKDGHRTEKLSRLAGAIQTLQLVSESLRESDSTKNSYWVNIDKIRKLVNDPDALQIYMGLLIQVSNTKKYRGIPFSTDKGDNFYSRLNTSMNALDFASDYNSYKQYILGIGTKAQELTKMIKEYEKPASDSLRVEQYAKYFKTTVQFIQSATQISELESLSNDDDLNTLVTNSKMYFDVAYEVSGLAVAINRKRYPEVVNRLIVTYNLIYAQHPGSGLLASTATLNKKQKAKPAEKMTKQNELDPSKAIADGTTNDNSASKQEKTKDTTAIKATVELGKLAKYGAFMSNMVTAKNSDEVSAAIESVALPVGSASIKRQSDFNVSLNAYCGLFLGSEKIKGLDDKFKINSFGIAAPIGISLSRGNSFLPWPFCFFEKGNSGFSSSLFISLVDLGAITAFRFQDSTTEQVPTIKLKDIISPGVFWCLGIPKTPISVNLGMQVGPNLRKVTNTTNDYSDKIYTRYSISVCVDLPLLNLYTKSKS